MIVTEVLPRTLDSVDLEADPVAARAWLRGRYAGPSEAWVRINMVASVTGAGVGADGTSDGLTGGADRAILAAIRAESDVVLVGAESVRAEGYVLPRTAALAILTRTGDLGNPTWDAAERGRVFVLCSQEAAAQVHDRVGGWATVLSAPGATLSPHVAVALLAERGLLRVVVEGGPHVASDAVAAGVVDEVCVTVAPRISPAAQPFLRVNDMLDTRVAGHLVDEVGFSYLRLRTR